TPVCGARGKRPRALEAGVAAVAGKPHLECGTPTYDVWEVQKLLQIGQISPRCVQLDVLQLLAMHSAREFYGLIVAHQAYLYEVKTLRPKNHLEWGRSVPGPARQPDLEFLEHHLLARRIPGQCPAGPPAALGGLDHLGGKQYLSFGPFISNIQGDLLDWQSPTRA